MTIPLLVAFEIDAECKPDLSIGTGSFPLAKLIAREGDPVERTGEVWYLRLYTPDAAEAARTNCERREIFRVAAATQEQAIEAMSSAIRGAVATFGQAREQQERASNDLKRLTDERAAVMSALIAADPSLAPDVRGTGPFDIAVEVAKRIKPRRRKS